MHTLDEPSLQGLQPACIPAEKPAAGEAVERHAPTSGVVIILHNDSGPVSGVQEPEEALAIV
jgi:hypothetical protein